MIRPLALAPGLLLLSCAWSQPSALLLGPHRMEISLERLDGTVWRTIDPGLVLAQGDRVRFRFRTNFDGYLYVMNQGTSGKYEQLFPRDETGQDNRIAANKEYQVPATSTVFRIAGPPGFEIVYWLVTPAQLTHALPHIGSPTGPAKPLTLLPRCDDTLLKSRGDCIDNSAGPKLVPRGDPVPDNLAQAADQGRRDLLFMRQNDTAVIASTEPLTGPVIYEFRLAHR